MAPTQITSSIMGKVVLTITPLEWLVVTHIYFLTGIQRKKKLSDYLNQFLGIIAILKALRA